MLWAAHGPIISRDAATARRSVLANRRRTVGPAPDALDATHRVAANGFKVRVNIRTPGPRRPSHAYRTPSPRVTYPVDGICYTALSRGGQIRRFCTDLKTGARKNTKPV